MCFVASAASFPVTSRESVGIAAANQSSLGSSSYGTIFFFFWWPSTEGPRKSLADTRHGLLHRSQSEEVIKQTPNGRGRVARPGMSTAAAAQGFFFSFVFSSLSRSFSISTHFID